MGKRTVIAAVAIVAAAAITAAAIPRLTANTTDTDGGSAPSAPSNAPIDEPKLVDAVPAWLAWVPGGFPGGFRKDAAELTRLGKDVVVAGDTRWLSATRAADGTIVDSPPEPYRFPIDAFAVHAKEYRPFVAEPFRRRVMRALTNGDAVLGRTSAEIRGIGVGGLLRFGSVKIRVGAVVADTAVGWAEMLVNRTVGSRLGISHERYLLALGTESLAKASFDDALRSILPSDSLLRVVAPGGVRYVRVASGVNPPVVVKSVFGEFAAYPNPASPAYLTIQPSWVKANIKWRTVPLLGRVQCHRMLFPMLIGALTEIKERGLGDTIKVYSGCYSPRTVQRSPTAPPSTHAYGAAIDINAPQSPFGAPPNFDRRSVAILEKWGFNWGGDFLIPDGHHFEFWQLRNAA